MTKVDIPAILAGAKHMVIIQADNPDADSLASALALEDILGAMEKEPYLYCAVDMPEYLRYLSGWDRVAKEIPKQFDATIIVDTSSITLLEKLQSAGLEPLIASRPVIILDHHAEVSNPITFATITLNNPSVVSTGELIYHLATEYKWPLSKQAQEYIMTSILADSMGLTSDNTTAETYRVMAAMVEAGISRPKLEEQRRAFSRMPVPIFEYKAELIKRTELFNGLAIVTIPQAEINEYSPLYNPAPLIQGDHLQITDVSVSVVLKHYEGGRITGAIRANYGAPIAAQLAESLGGGGHAYAAGFKVENGVLDDIKQHCITQVTTLLEGLKS